MTIKRTIIDDVKDTARFIKNTFTEHKQLTNQVKKQYVEPLAKS